MNERLESVNVRNLEQIQESDSGRRSSRLGAFVLASLAGAALVATAVLVLEKKQAPTNEANDPLASLIAEAKNDEQPPEKLNGNDVTFPGLLSDNQAPTTALAAVKDERGRLVKQAEAFQLPAGHPTAPPPAGDRLPVVPLPAGQLLAATPVTEQPKDSLTDSAIGASKPAPDGEVAEAGHEGGYQLQVASFKKQEDADKFAEDLRKRQHRAYRQAAHVPGRGLWHRVRIGPFKTHFQALKYKKRFEKSERVAPFIVDPHKVKQASEIRAAKLAARKRRYGGR